MWKNLTICVKTERVSVIHVLSLKPKATSLSQLYDFAIQLINVESFRLNNMLFIYQNQPGKGSHAPSKACFSSRNNPILLILFLLGKASPL